MAVSSVDTGCKKAMRKKTILLLGQDDLLSNFVILLLSEHAGWDVIVVSMEQDLADIFHAVEHVEPDVVISQEENRGMDSKILPVLFRSNPVLKVITLNLKSNLMEIYSKENILVESAADLISAIEA